MSQFEKDKAQFAQRVRSAFPASLSFGRSEYQRRVRAQKEVVANLQHEIDAIRAEAQEAALQLYMLAQDNVTSVRGQDDDTLLLPTGEAK